MKKIRKVYAYSWLDESLLRTAVCDLEFDAVRMPREQLVAYQELAVSTSDITICRCAESPLADLFIQERTCLQKTLLIDNEMPRDEIQFLLKGEIVGKIVHLAVPEFYGKSLEPQVIAMRKQMNDLFNMVYESLHPLKKKSYWKRFWDRLLKLGDELYKHLEGE